MVGQTTEYEIVMYAVYIAGSFMIALSFIWMILIFLRLRREGEAKNLFLGILSDNLGVKWKWADREDLVEWDGTIYVIKGIKFDGIYLDDGVKDSPPIKVDVYDLIPGKPAIFYRQDEGYLQAWKRFLQQQLTQTQG